MDVGQKYDALIMVTPKDYLRLKNNYHRLVENLPVSRVLFVGNTEVGRLVENSGLGSRAEFISEDRILPFEAVHDVMKEVLDSILEGQELPRGITGWYYQQFLKMQYTYLCEDPYYMIWDGDTISCRSFSMFHEESGIPYFDLKREYHQEYFITLAKLIPGLEKSIEKSFVSEHMLMRCDIMKSLIEEIEHNQEIPGKSFWEKILRVIGPERIQKSSFSEFETYGTYVCARFPEAYRIRNWYSFRQGGMFFDPDTITEQDYEWLGRDFYAISFEKGHSVREDHKNLFDNPQFQEKLSARTMLEAAQQEFTEGYLEVWDETH
mgnify:FL=1